MPATSQTRGIWRTTQQTGKEDDVESRLYARLCHTFLVFAKSIYCGKLNEEVIVRSYKDVTYYGNSIGYPFASVFSSKWRA